MNWYVGLLVGAVAGIVRVGLGWFRSGEKWALDKALRTFGIALIEGGLIGAFAGKAAKETFAIVFAGTVAVEEVIVGLWRKS